MILKNCLDSWKWNKSWSQSHTMVPLHIIVLFFYSVCICCRPSAVKSCNIFAKIFTSQAEDIAVSMSSNCLLTPNRFCGLAIPLEHFFFSFFLFFLSGAFTSAVEVMPNMRALPKALNSLSGNGLFCFTVKTTLRFPERKKKTVLLIVSEGEYNMRENHVIECIIISTTELVKTRPCWYKQCRRHIDNMLLSPHQLKTCCFLPEHNSLWVFPNETLM